MPALITDASQGTDKVPPLARAKRTRWRSRWRASYRPLPEMDEVYGYIDANYKFVGFVGPGRWPAYGYSPGRNDPLPSVLPAGSRST